MEMKMKKVYLCNGCGDMTAYPIMAPLSGPPHCSSCEREMDGPFELVPVDLDGPNDGNLSPEVMEYLRKPYARVLCPEEDGGFSTYVLEFPGCYGMGETVRQAYHTLESVAASWIDACLEQGNEIPRPRIDLLLDESLEEALADLAHEMWSGWMKYLFSKTEPLGPRPTPPATTVRQVIPGESVERWKRQMTTPYSELPVEERESDRVEARKMIRVFDRIFGRGQNPVEVNRLREVIREALDEERRHVCVSNWPDAKGYPCTCFACYLSAEVAAWATPDGEAEPQ